MEMAFTLMLSQRYQSRQSPVAAEVAKEVKAGL
jgi:hypothetical protein